MSKEEALMTSLSSSGEGVSFCAGRGFRVIRVEKLNPERWKPLKVWLVPGVPGVPGSSFIYV